METPVTTSRINPLSRSDSESAPSVERFATEDAVWTVSADWRDRLLANDAPYFWDLDRAPGASRIKTGLNRTVWRVEWPGARLLCKVFSKGRPWHRIGVAIRGTHAQREFEAACRARQRAVGVPMPIAWGRQIVPPYHSVVLSEFLTGAVPLSGIDSAYLADRRLLSALASFFAQSHNAGVTHRDGHPGNLLVRLESGGDWRVWFVDVHGLVFAHKRLWVAHAARSLGQLDHHYAPVLSRSSRLRFLVRYMRLRDWAPGDRTTPHDIRAFARLVDASARAHAVRLAWRRDRRLRGSGRYFARLDLDRSWSAFVVLTLARRRLDPAAHVSDRSVEEWRDLFADVLAGLEQALEDDRASPRSVHSESFRFLVWTHRSRFDQLRVSAYGSPARLAFNRAHRLRHRDLPSPVPLAYVEKRVGLSTVASVLVLPTTTDRVPGGAS